LKNAGSVAWRSERLPMGPTVPAEQQGNNRCGIARLVVVMYKEAAFQSFFNGVTLVVVAAATIVTTDCSVELVW
jgi:hypothetical protein